MTSRRSPLLVALLAACAGDPSSVAFEDFSREAHEAACDWAVRCHHVPTRADCERLLDPKDYDPRRARDSIEAGLSTYDPAAAARCLEATRDGFCLTPSFSDPSCAKVFVGTQEIGEACSSVRECRTGRCDLASCPGQCCTGSCAEAEPPVPAGGAGPGEACAGHGDCVASAYCETDRRCATFGDRVGDRCLIGCARGDLYCDIESFSCRPFGELGQACDGSVPGALPCDPAWAVCDGVCRPRPGLGEACNQTDRLCIPVTRCDPASGRCVARAELGEACEDEDDCEARCNGASGVCELHRPCSE